MSGLKLLVCLSSVRETRNADRMFKLVSRLATEKGFVVDVLDPLKENLPMLKSPLHFYPDQSKAPQQLIALNQKVSFADAYLFVTGEYNYGVPPALLNMIDHVPPPSFSFKATGVVSYSAGPSGQRSCSHLLDTLNYFGCLVQPFMVHVAAVQNSISEDGQVLSGHWEENIKILLDQIEYTGVAMKNLKQSGKLKQPRLNNNF